MSSDEVSPDNERCSKNDSAKIAEPLNVPQPEDEPPSCLKIIDRVRQRSGSVDPDWLFGDEDETEPFRSESVETELPERIGRFKIVRQLGRGGYGIVFLAVDPELNREVALKVPGSDVLGDEVLQRRFLREGEAAAVLNHPHIVTVYESGRVGAVHYIASEYVEGGTLEEWLRRNGHGIEPVDAAGLIRVLAGALQHAHSRGVLHRDIKPGNILLDRNRKESLAASELAASVRLCDFGLARIQESQRDQSVDATRDSILGTPAYMSPEQAEGRNQDVTAGSDIYALGVVLYELMVGETPFKRSTWIATLKAIWENKLVPPSRLRANVPADLEAICLECLQKDPLSRYHTADALADDLGRFLGAEPVTARRLSRIEHVARWCRRNPVVSALLTTVLVLMMVIAVGSSAAVIQLSKSRRDVLNHLEQETLAKDKATKQGELAIRALFEARATRGRLGVLSGQEGQRTESLKALEQAAAMIPRLNFGDEETLMLRNDAIAAMSLIDLIAVKRWDAKTAVVTWDSQAEHYASMDLGPDILSVYRISDEKRIAQFHRKDKAWVPRRTLFSPKGRFLACKWSKSNAWPNIEVWDWKSEKLLHAQSVPADLRGCYIDFSFDDTLLAVVDHLGKVRILKTSEFSEWKTIDPQQTVFGIRLNPDATRIAVARNRGIDLYELETGKLLRSIPCSSFTYRLAWSRDGQMLAAGCEDRGVRIWRTDSDQVVLSEKLTTQVTNVDFHCGGRFLASCGFDQLTRIWDVHQGKLVLQIPGSFECFSRDGHWLCSHDSLWRVDLPEEHRITRHPLRHQDRVTVVDELRPHQRGQIAIAFNRNHFMLWGLSSVEPLVTRHWPGYFQMSNTGDAMIHVSTTGIFRLPIQIQETQDELTYRFGEPKQIAEGMFGNVDVSSDGNMVACANRYLRPSLIVFDLKKKQKKILTPHHPNAKWVSLSPDGKLLASSPWHGKEVRIWDVETGKVIKIFKASKGVACAEFSPDGRQLVIDEGFQFSVWDVPSWKEVVSATRKDVGSNIHSGFAISGDSRILAMPDSDRHVRLLDTQTWAELASFKLHPDYGLSSLAFTQDGTKLIAGTEGDVELFHIWDLARIRSRLKSMNLDWNHSPLPHQPDESKRLRITMDGQSFSKP